ncbi:MAG TPA: winged helix DNA-binding domain-containing protein [Candidatus Limnocylindria bacterium]|nr:winged helix DNA-binding domain-containing protein [Candidatus Limnocylindria bacterium]
MTPRVTWRQALSWRLERHLLGAEKGDDAADVVRRLCAVQAQVPSSAELAIRIRCASSRVGSLAAALREGRLIRTWAMRGTLHLLSPEEGGIFLSLIAARKPWEGPGWVKWFGMTPEVVAAMVDAAREALDGRELTREELIGAITSRTKLRHLAGPLRESWGTALKPLAWQGELCFGAGTGGRATFRHPASSPRWRGLPPIEEAAPAAIEAYLGAYGPATIDNFHSWTQWTASKRMLRSWWNAERDRMAEVELDGERAFVMADDLDSLLAAQPTDAVRLVPGFDQWVLGLGTNDPHVVPPARRSAVSRQSGWISPAVLAGGVVSGTWQLEGDTVRVEWFLEAGSAPNAALDEEVARLSRIVGRSLVADVTASGT